MDYTTPSFSDFLTQSPKYNKFEGNKVAKAVFDLMSEEQNIIAMVDASLADKPALLAVVRAVEALMESNPDPHFNLNDDFSKQSVGSMVKTILEPFGYRVFTQRVLPKATKGNYFTSATTYKFDDTSRPTLQVVRKIAPITY